MAARKLPQPVEAAPVPETKTGVDRKALRDDISRRYEHTLRRLGQ